MNLKLKVWENFRVFLFHIFTNEKSSLVGFFWFYYFILCIAIEFLIIFEKKVLLTKKGRNERSLKYIFLATKTPSFFYSFFCVYVSAQQPWIPISFVKFFFGSNTAKLLQTGLSQGYPKKNEINKNCFRSFHAQSGFKKL